MGADNANRSTDDRLYANVDLQFRGDRVLIVQTLQELSAALQAIVNDRAVRRNAIVTGSLPQTAVDAPAFLHLVSNLARRLSALFRDVESRFGQAASPAGSPQMLCDVYAEFLDGILDVAHALWSTRAPQTFASTEKAFREFVGSLYDQLTHWPATLAAGAAALSSNEYRGRLTVSCDLRPYYRALEAESA